MNVFLDFPLTRKNYLRHPLIFMRHCIDNLRAAWQRATKGYANRDLCEMNDFLLFLIPSMLRQLAEGRSYPHNNSFPTLKSWSKWCTSLAEKFEQTQRENWELTHSNKYERKLSEAANVLNWQHMNYSAIAASTLTYEQAEEIWKLYAQEELDIITARKEKIKENFNELSQHYIDLWI